MEHRTARTPKTILSLPNSGHSSVWTGRTVSGQSVHSVVALPNRTVQLHFFCNDNIPPYTRSFENSHYERLATFWYEYPMRHLGVQVDDLDGQEPLEPAQPAIQVPNIEPQQNMRSGLANGGPVQPFRPRRLFDQRPHINHLRLTHAPTIGREMVYGCPRIGNDLALSTLQAKSVLYTHHESGSVNVLIIKIFIEPAENEFDTDHTEHYIGSRTFPGFNFHQPLMLRDRFRMGNLTNISRNRNPFMFESVLHFKITDDRMPRVQNCSLHIQLDDILIHHLSTDSKTLKSFFTHESTSHMLETILLELGRRKLLNTNSARIPAKVCAELFELIRDDSCIKTLADYLSTDSFFKLIALFRTSYQKPRLNIFFSIHA